uniref:Uncharacterized protein n=1 Tax=Tanacetum cinerariifolium TaxID=118510 RepID=A0A6L2KDP8_TANCI|nr:hypothetical protein [Tanacetum cinerariifolium]
MAEKESSQPLQPPIASTEALQMVSYVKLLILKKVILNGNSVVQMTKDEAGNEIEVPPVTAQQILARTRERKAKNTLLMDIPDKLLARFHGIKDAKTLWTAIKTKFGAWSNISLIMRNKPGIDNLDINNLYNNLKVYEADIKGSSESSSNSQNVAFISVESTSSTNELNATYSISTTTDHSSQAQGSSSYADEFMFLFFANQSHTLQLDKKDLKQIDQDDLEEIDLKWQVVMLSMRVKQVNNKTGRKLEFNGKEPVGFDKNKVEYFNCYRRGHLARDCRSARNSGNKSKDVRNAGYRGRDNGKRFAKKEDEKALVVQDGLEAKVIETVFDNYLSDEENSVANDRFKKGEGYHAVPPLLTGNYMPPKPDLSFARLDHSIYKFKISETVTSLAKDDKDAPKTSTACVEKPKEDRFSAPLIKDWETDSDDDNVFTPKPIPAKIDFVKAALFTRSSRILVSAAKPKAAASTSAAKPVNTAGPKQSVNFSRTRSTFHKSHSPIKRSFYNATTHSRRNSTERVNVVGSKAVSVVKGNKDTAFKTSTGYVWRPSVNAIYQLSKDNRWICTRGHPQQALKNKGIVDSVCSRHMTGNKAYLADYQKITDGGFVAFGSSKGKITGKASINESNLWHMRLGHVNFKTMNKLVKGNLVRGLPSKIFNNDHSCVACQKGKHHKATLIDDFSRFSWVCFLASKDELNSTAKWSCKKKNRTLIKAVRTMLADSLLPITFWAEEVNTACYVLNKALVIKTQNKTHYELLNGRTPRLYFMRPFGCLDTILNILDPLGKFEGKADEGFLVGYSVTSKAFRVFNTKTKKIKENLHVRFLENKPNVARTGPNWIFDIDSLTNSMNYIPVFARNKTNKNAGPQDTNGNASTQDNVDAGKEVSDQHYIVLPLWSSISSTYKSSDDKSIDDKPKDDISSKTVKEPVNKEDQAYRDELDKLMSQEKEASDAVDALRKEFEQGCIDHRGVTQAGSNNSVNTFSNPLNAASTSGTFTATGPSSPHHNAAYDDDLDKFGSLVQSVGVEDDFNNMESSTIFSLIPTHKVHIDYPKDQILGDLKSAVQIRGMAKKSYGAHALMEPKKVSQALDDESWVEAMQEELLEGSIWSTPSSQSLDKDYIMLVQVYVDDITFGSTKKSLCDEFEALMHKRFQMSSMGGLTFFLGLHVQHSEEGIFISQDKYVAEILKNFDFASVKTASTPIETQKPLGKDENMLLLLTAMDSQFSKANTCRIDGKAVVRSDLLFNDKNGGHTPISDEGRPNINELMNLYTQLSKRVLALEQFKTTQDLVIQRFLKKVKRLEKKQRARTLGMKLFKIGTSKKKTLDKEYVSKQGMDEISTGGDAVNVASVVLDVIIVGPSTSTTGDIFEDDMITMADTLMAIRRKRPRTTSVVIHDVEEEPRRATPPPTAQIQRDAEITQRLFEEEQAQFEREGEREREREQRVAREKAAKQKARDVVLIEQMEDVQERIDADALLAKRLQQEEREQFTVNEEHKWINDFVPMDFEEVNDSEQQAKDDIAIDVESLATKYPLVDGKTHTLTENMIQDIIDLYMLVKERYETASPEGYDLLLWEDLITLFKRNEKDVIWKAQRDYNLIS